MEAKEVYFESLLDHDFAEVHRPLLPVRDQLGIAYFFHTC